MRFVLVAIGALCAAACATRTLKPGEGFIPVRGGRVWYRIVGAGHKTPLLLLHGGPGAPSYYLKPLAALGDERPVVFYDQLGCGHSDHPTDSTLWTVERFVDELAQVREALGLEQVHILGTSWGTMLAMDYMLTKPSGVRSIIMASPALDIRRWIKDADSLLSTLPDSTQTAIHENERAGTTDSPAYQNAMLDYYHRFVSRTDPWTPDIDSALAQIGMPVYLAMCGPSEFTITGSLKDYDRTPQLGELKLPVLFTCGRYDEATPATVASYQRLVPGSEMVIFEHSAHLTM